MTESSRPTTGPAPSPAPAPRPVVGPAVGSKRRVRLSSLLVALVAAASTLAGALFASPQMAWPGSQSPCAAVAVTAAANQPTEDACDLLDYHITAGHSHGPPTVVDAHFLREHTYYVAVGNTPVLVHNCGEAEVRDAIQDAFPDRSVRMNRQVQREDGFDLTDHEVYDDDFVCEVACGAGKGKSAQVLNNLLPSLPAGTRLAVYGPNMGGTVTKAIEGMGVPVFRRIEDLIAWVGPRR